VISSIQTAVVVCVILGEEKQERKYCKLRSYTSRCEARSWPSSAAMSRQLWVGPETPVCTRLLWT